MAKLLGQEIVTNEEFEEFKASELNKIETQGIMNAVALAGLKTEQKAIKFIAIVAGSALVVSIGSLISTLLH